jgi:hypothetical protein
VATTRQERTIVRQERILDAIVDGIADGARTPKSGLDFHRPGKDVTFLALLDRPASQLLTRLAERAGGPCHAETDLAKPGAITPATTKSELGDTQRA